MMTIDLSELKDLAWYAYVIAGFCVGMYIHSARIRHVIHWLIVNILRGFIWLFQRTDPLYKAPKPAKVKPDKTTTEKPAEPTRDYNRTGIEVGESELAKYLQNPDVSVVNR